MRSQAYIISMEIILAQGRGRLIFNIQKLDTQNISVLINP